MEYQLYSVYDRVAGSFGEPFVAINFGVAQRRFNYVMGTASMVADDCDLYLVGKFNADTGEVVSVKPEFKCHYEVEQ